MNSTLRDLFRHNAWATDVLINVCRELTEEQLNTNTPGAYGNPRATLQHMVLAEGWYQSQLTGVPPSREWTPGTELTLDEIAARRRAGRALGDVPEIRHRCRPYDPGQRRRIRA